MRKTAIGELKPQRITLENRCPKCGGQLKALVMVGLGAIKPQKQSCVDQCGFEKDISKVKHG